MWMSKEDFFLSVLWTKKRPSNAFSASFWFVELQMKRTETKKNRCSTNTTKITFVGLSFGFLCLQSHFDRRHYHCCFCCCCCCCRHSYLKEFTGHQRKVCKNWYAFTFKRYKHTHTKALVYSLVLSVHLNVCMCTWATINYNHNWRHNYWTRDTLVLLLFSHLI